MADGSSYQEAVSAVGWAEVRSPTFAASDALGFVPQPNLRTAQLLNDIEQLPPEAQHQIEDFIAFIKTHYQSTTKTKLSEEEFVGMWGNRPEMQDSAVGWADVRKPNICRSDVLGFVPQPNLRTTN